MGTSLHRQRWHVILGELAFGRTARRTGVVGDQKADPEHAIVSLELAQRDGGGVVNCQVGTAADANERSVRGLGTANGAVAQRNLLPTAA